MVARFYPFICVLNVNGLVVRLDCLGRYWYMGSKQNSYVGLGYYQLRILGRYWSRGNVDFCHPAFVPSKVENVDQQECGSDDDFCGTLCGSISTVPHGTCMVGLLGVTIAKRMFGSLWVNFNSPLLWDVFAISTYLSVSLLFWYLGLIPDIATVRDRAVTKARKFWYGFFAMGWNGSARTWHRYEIVALILAGVSTPLVLSVHTIVSMDFATSVIPGWHTTIFPPYFVAGAIFSGFGMVLTLLIIVRKVLNLNEYITIGHLDAMTKVVMLTGSLVGVAYLTEFFIAAYSGMVYEQYAFLNRAFGPYWWAYWTMMSCNLLAPQVFWFKWARTTPWFIFILSIVVNIGMWFERFVIIVTSLHRDYLTSSWAMYSATITEVGIFLGTMGLFFTCFFLFSKFLPVINMSEVKSIIKSRE